MVLIMKIIKKYWYFALIFIATVGLGVLTFILSQRLTTTKPVAPTVPETKPQAAQSTQCKLVFDLPTPTSTPTGTLKPSQTPTKTPTPTRTPTPTPTPNPQCGNSCETDTQCPNNHTCDGGVCILTRCLETNVVCNDTRCNVIPTPTPTRIPTPTRTPTSEPTPTIEPSATPTTFVNQTPECIQMTADTTSASEPPATISFTCTGNDADGEMTAVEFSFGDGKTQLVEQNVGTSGDISTSYTYNKSGTFTASCRVRDNNFKFSTTAQACKTTITINNPIAEVVPTEAPIPEIPVAGIGPTWLGGLVIGAGTLLLLLGLAL